MKDDFVSITSGGEYGTTPKDIRRMSQQKTEEIRSHHHLCQRINVFFQNRQEGRQEGKAEYCDSMVARQETEKE